MDDWAITTTAVVALLLLGAIIFSILRPSSRVRIGVFFEREIEEKKDQEDPPEDDTQIWPMREE